MNRRPELPVFDRRAGESAVPDLSVTLSSEQRGKGRLRAHTTIMNTGRHSPGEYGQSVPKRRFIPPMPRAGPKRRRNVVTNGSPAGREHGVYDRRSEFI